MPAVSPTALDWKQFEQSLLALYWRDAQAFLAAHPDETIYAFALNGLYREEDGPIYLPTLAANSEQAYAQVLASNQGKDFDEFAQNAGQLGSLRWNPADWGWEELDSGSDDPAYAQLNDALIAEANKGTPTHWQRTEARLIKVLLSICKAMTKACKKSAWASQLSPQFAVLLITLDDEESEQLARQSLGEALFLKLFPSHDKEAQRRARIAALPAALQLQYQLACLQGVALEELGLSAQDASLLGEEAETALLAMDHALVAHALLPVLAKPKAQWRAAMMLAQMAWRDDAVLAALRQHVQQALKHRSEESGRNWCASALGAIGDQDWLLQQLGTAALPAERIAQGVAYPYRAWNSKPGTAALRLDYAPLELALSLGHLALTSALNEELSPGSGFCSLRLTDMDEAIRGLRSPHLLVRVHAACIMGERSLGAAAGKRIVPALAQALRQDANEGVRYQAMLGLQDWKKASASQLANIEHAAERDACAAVRELAQNWLNTYR